MVAYTVLPGLILCFTAMLLLFMVSLSAPTIAKISFLDATINGTAVHFGAFGYTGTKRTLGYTIDEVALGLSDSLLNVAVITSLTKVLSLHTVAAIVLFIAFLLGGCAAANHTRIHTIMMCMTMLVALFFIALAFAVDVILFDLIGERIRADGYSAQLGRATWMTLLALIIVFLGVCASGCGALRDSEDGGLNINISTGRKRRGVI